MSDNYEEVGYGNPPKHTQWKKGQSGNPSGKKKKEESLFQIMKRLAGQEVVVHKSGVQMSMTQGEAMLTSVFAKAMKGDLACAKFLHSELGMEMNTQKGTALATSVTEADIACLKSHADWVGIIESAQADNGDNEEESGDADEPG